MLDTRGVLRADDLGLTAVHVFGWIKWTALAVVVIGVVLVFGLRELARAGRAVLRALPALWLQLLIVALFTLAVAVPDQSADAIRRLSLGQWAFTLSVTAVFSFVLLATGLGALRPTTPRPARDTSDVVWSGLPVLALGVVVIAASRLTSFHGLLVPGAIITAVGFVSLVLDVLARRESGGARDMLERADSDARADGEPRAPQPPERAVARRHVAVALALTPVAAFGIAAVRSSAGDVALLGAGPSGRVAARLVIGCLLVVGAGALVLPVNQLGKWLVTLADGPRLAVLGVLVALHAPGVLMHDPDVNIGHAHQVGALALVMVFLSGFALLPTAAAWLAYLLMSFRYSRPFAVPSAVRILRFDTTPVLGLITLWALLAGLVSYRDYHDIRRVAAADSPNAADATPKSLDEVVAGWFSRQTDEGPDPALLVAASGGGIRAAYWTAAVLDCIIERDGPSIDPCSRSADPDVVAARRRALMVMSGISGGSLGLAAYVTAVGEQWSPAGDTDPLAPGWYDERLGDDYLAPDVAAWLFNDGLNALLRPNHGVDRAAVMERAWEASWDGGELAAAFLAGQASGDEPLLLLSGYNVEDGCRVNTSVLDSAHGAAVSTCRSVPNGQLSLLRATADLTAQLCPGDDIRMSTAALNSARFPFVSPSGRVPGCTRAQPSGPGAPPDLEVVDGGYRETSGASPIVELWPGLTERFRDTAADRCAAPLFLQIDNGYASDAVSSSGARVVGQEIVPVVAFSNSSGGIESAARQGSLDMLDEHYGGDTRGSEWFRITTFAHPGLERPARLGALRRCPRRPAAPAGAQRRRDRRRADQARLPGGLSGDVAVVPVDVPSPRPTGRRGRDRRDAR